MKPFPLHRPPNVSQDEPVGRETEFLPSCGLSGYIESFPGELLKVNTHCGAIGQDSSLSNAKESVGPGCREVRVADQQDVCGKTNVDLLEGPEQSAHEAAMTEIGQALIVVNAARDFLQMGAQKGAEGSH